MNASEPKSRWLAPSENRWGLEVFDCSANARSRISMTGDPRLAQSYVRLRNATREDLLKTEFAPTVSGPCKLAYSIGGELKDGPLFKSRVMEQKWDVYLYSDKLYFCRSWSGQIMYRASAGLSPQSLEVRSIEGVHEDAGMAVRDIDFLIKTHILLTTAVHPLPKTLNREIAQLETYSFSAFGRMGQYGTFEETVGTPYFL